MSYVRFHLCSLAMLATLTMGCLEPVTINPLQDCSPGEKFKSNDGCNECVCPDSGLQADAQCTEISCEYNACEDKMCGEACSPCDPDNALCVAPAVATACNTQGACVAATPSMCGVYDPCEGKVCGESCSPCEPGDPDCASLAVETSCNPAGVCVTSTPDICEGDLCLGVTCPGSDPYCSGNVAILGEPEGKCNPNSGQCEYPDWGEGAIDCEGSGMICKAGQCVDPGTDLCEGVTCPGTKDYCNGNVAMPGSPEGMCEPKTGLCVYPLEEEGAIDCAGSGMICKAGQCVDPGTDLCGFGGLECEPGATCDVHGCGQDAIGTCVGLVDGCTDIYEPVCGCDGVTYSNDCHRIQIYGAALKHKGECEGPTTCAAMNAKGVGPCAAEFGVAWDGTQCVSISGCDCKGPDCNKLYNSFAACEKDFDACLPVYDPCEGKVCGESCALCDPNDPNCAETPETKACNYDGQCVSEFETGCTAVPSCDGTKANGVGPCDAFFGWVWDGEVCYPISGCECQGADCNNFDKFYPDKFQCEQNHSHCGVNYNPCGDKACGQPCSVCDPDDPNCGLTGEFTVCNSEGQCVPDNELTCPAETSLELNMCMGGVIVNSDPFWFQDAGINGDTLIAAVSYSGGCESHSFSACVTPFNVADPGLVGIIITHNANNDMCEAVISETLSIDLEPLKKEWISQTGAEHGEIPLYILGLEQVIIYSF